MLASLDGGRCDEVSSADMISLLYRRIRLYSYLRERARMGVPVRVCVYVRVFVIVGFGVVDRRAPPINICA